MDVIERQAAIKTAHLPTIEDAGYEVIRLDDILTLPSAQPDNQVHLCDSCSYTYPDCPSVYTDVIFGNGIGNDNICACSKYLPSAQFKQTEGEKDEWIEAWVSGYPAIHHRRCNTFIYAPNGEKGYNFCPRCGYPMKGDAE